MLRKIGLILASLVAVLVVFRIWFLPDLLSQQMAVIRPNGPERPSDLGMAYEDASFDVDGDRLEAWFVRAPDPKPLAFLLHHGDGGRISGWLTVQKLLYDRGYSSLAFSYAGYGGSEGQPGVRMFRDEPRQALSELLRRIDSDTRVILLGHSLGAAIAVEAFHDYDEPRIQALIFGAGPPALRDILIEVVKVPSWIAALLPQLINAKENIADFRIPVLVIGSEGDTVITADMVRRVYDGATEPKELIMWELDDHNELVRANDSFWEPVFAWIETTH